MRAWIRTTAKTSPRPLSTDSPQAFPNGMQSNTLAFIILLYIKNISTSAKVKGRGSCLMAVLSIRGIHCSGKKGAGGLFEPLARVRSRAFSFCSNPPFLTSIRFCQTCSCKESGAYLSFLHLSFVILDIDTHLRAILWSRLVCWEHATVE